MHERRPIQLAPNSHRPLGPHISLTPKSQRCPSLHMSLTAKSLLWMNFRTSLTKASSCSLLSVEEERPPPEQLGERGENMKNIKFVVKVNRSGTRAPEYVQRVDPSPIHMTTNRKLALVMGKFAAEDAVKSLQTSQCIPELVPVEVTAEPSGLAVQD